MKEIKTLKELDSILKDDDNKLIYCGGTDCPSCQVLKPKIEELEKEYSTVVFYRINCQSHKRVSLQLKVVGLPVVILYKGSSENKRFIKEQCEIEDIKNELNKIK